MVCLNCGLSNVAVLDVDVPKGHAGKDGRVSWKSLLDEYILAEPLPNTLRQKTRSGGTHYIFSGHIKNSVGAFNKEGKRHKLGAGLDTKGDGGMVVLYEPLPLNSSAPLAPVPEWLVELVGAPVERARGKSEFEPVYTAEEIAERLKLIDVSHFDGNQDKWLPLFLACTHASTCEDCKEEFMDWTTEHGKGTYADDYEAIAARWDANMHTRNDATGKGAAAGVRHVQPLSGIGWARGQDQILRGAMRGGRRF